MSLIFYDTETTGLPLWREPSEHRDQPHIVQLAAILTDDDLNEISSLNVIVRPDGWSIPEDVAKIHGITTERALRYGIPEKLALEAFMNLWAKAAKRVAHNESFDARIVRIATMRFGDEGVQQKWDGGPSFCTMKKAAPICNLPGSGRKGPKNPSLSEAFAHLTGANLVNAHDAMADTRACLSIYRCIRGETPRNPGAGQQPADADAAAGTADDDRAFG